jgi:hypothetical protein
VRPLHVRLMPSRWVVAREALVSAGLALGAVFALARALTPALLVLAPVTLLLGVFYVMRATGLPRTPLASGLLGQRDDLLSVEGHTVAARSSVRAGAVIPESPDGVIVRLERARGDVELGVPDVETGQLVLQRLKLDVRHAVARFRVLSDSADRWRAKMRRIVALPFVLGLMGPIAARAGAPWVLALLVPALIVTVLASLWPGRVTVGADGLVGRRLLRGWFRPFDGVADVRIVEEPYFTASLVIVELVDPTGAAIERLVVDQKKNGPFQEGVHAAIDARAFGLAERIREALELRQGKTEGLDRAALGRGGRDAEAWVAGLRALLSRKPTFRDAGPPSVEALLALVEDVGVPPVDRAAAAAALPRDDRDARRRVRVAAETSVEPALRLALEAAAADDEPSLREALTALDAGRGEA